MTPTMTRKMPTIFTIYWVSADKQEQWDLGSHRTSLQALSSIDRAEEELLAECQSHAEVDAVNAGSYIVVPEEC